MRLSRLQFMAHQRNTELILSLFGSHMRRLTRSIAVTQSFDHLLSEYYFFIWTFCYKMYRLIPVIAGLISYSYRVADVTNVQGPRPSSV